MNPSIEQLRRERARGLRLVASEQELLYEASHWPSENEPPVWCELCEEAPCACHGPSPRKRAANAGMVAAHLVKLACSTTREPIASQILEHAVTRVREAAGYAWDVIEAEASSAEEYDEVTV